MSDATYPAHREADVVLHDGSTVSLRPVRPDDEERLRGASSPGSTPTRRPSASSPAPSTWTAPRRLMAEVDYEQPLRAARRSRPGPPAGRPRRLPRARPRPRPRSPSPSPTRCRAAASARSCSPTWPRPPARTASRPSVAEVLPQNHRMIEMFRESGFPVEIESSRRRPAGRVPDLALAGGDRPLRGSRPARRPGRRRRASCGRARSRSSAPPAAAAPSAARCSTT